MGREKTEDMDKFSKNNKGLFALLTTDYIIHAVKAVYCVLCTVYNVKTEDSSRRNFQVERVS